MVEGHASDSTPFIFRRSAARWSSGDHLRGAAACAVSPHCGHVVLSENALQVRHCCMRWRATVSLPRGDSLAACCSHVGQDSGRRLFPHGFSNLEIGSLQFQAVVGCAVIEAFHIDFFFFV